MAIGGGDTQLKAVNLAEIHPRIVNPQNDVSHRPLPSFPAEAGNHISINTSSPSFWNCPAIYSTKDAWIAATAILLDCILASHHRGICNIPNLKLILKSLGDDSSSSISSRQ